MRLLSEAALRLALARSLCVCRIGNRVSLLDSVDRRVGLVKSEIYIRQSIVHVVDQVRGCWELGTLALQQLAVPPRVRAHVP